MMKHYRLTASDVIGWMRICRPGMVIGPQQQFLQDLEPVMWQEGDMLRIAKCPSLLKSDAPVSPTDRSGGSSKKRSVKSSSKLSSSSSIQVAVTPPPLSTTTEESLEAKDGRPGQAEGLLANRRRRQQQQAAAVANQQTKMDSGSMPVPVTPDSVVENSNNNKSRGFGDRR